MSHRGDVWFLHFFITHNVHIHATLNLFLNHFKHSTDDLTTTRFHGKMATKRTSTNLLSTNLNDPLSMNVWPTLLTSNLLLRSVGDYLHEKNHNNKPNEKFHQPISGDKLWGRSYNHQHTICCSIRIVEVYFLSKIQKIKRRLALLSVLPFAQQQELHRLLGCKIIHRFRILPKKDVLRKPQNVEL
jgi:hypothetical protein